MTDYAAQRIAAQVDALNGDAPVGAVLDLVLENTRPEVQDAVRRWRQRARPCQEGDDVIVARACHDDHAPATVPAALEAL